jgi:hypothetical protein
VSALEFARIDAIAGAPWELEPIKQLMVLPIDFLERMLFVGMQERLTQPLCIETVRLRKCRQCARFHLNAVCEFDVSDVALPLRFEICSALEFFLFREGLKNL